MIGRRSLLKWLFGAFAGGFGLASYGFAIEPAHRLAVARYRIRPDGWPQGMRLTIAALSDIHASEPQMGLARIREVVRQTNALGADIILMLGDYGMGQTLYARPVPLPLLAEALEPLSAPLGVYGILGNHDYWGTSLTNWPYTPEKIDETAEHYRVMLREAGVTLLENDVRRIDKGGQPFWLIGTGSLIALPIAAGRFRSYARLDEQVARITDDAPAILMAHEPDLFPSVPRRIGLTLSGHTHGGQVRLFGYSPVTPSKYRNRYAYGHVVEDGRNLIVSGGLGTSVMPVRFGVPPEIVLIEIG